MLNGMSSEEALPVAPSDQAVVTRALGRTLIDTFGRGWSKGDVDLLMSVLAPGVIFIDNPFSEPIRGTEAVRRYWLEVPYNQSEVSFSSGEIYSAGPWFSTEFKCVFRRRRTGEWIDTRGAVFCETEGERIVEMRMYWHSTTSG
jgi:ketosteroid isomerase-like protein